MTIHDALIWAQKKLDRKNNVGANCYSPLLDAEVILGYVLGKPREWLLARTQDVRQGHKIQDTISKKITNNKLQTNFKFQISNAKLSKFKKLIKQRAKGVPVAYLTGHKEFFGLDFYVDRRVLIPRPETELLVEATLEMLESLEAGNVTIVDVGTGSGCVAVAIAHTLKAGKRLPAFRCEVYATDISKDALAVGRKNARRHNVDPACSRGGASVKFLQGDLLVPVIERGIRPDIVVANLPYLRADQIKGDIKYEPHEALDGGCNGLKYYEKLFEQMENGKWKMENCVFEIGPGQVGAMKSLIKKHLPGRKVRIRKDLAGRERVVVVSF